MPGLTPKGRDSLVMGTNSSSIVSKRSVERIYFPHDPQCFRFFVNKFQRRAPLINRGYYLRMHLIDAVVRMYLGRPSAKTKVVVNLGCGSDPLPWRTMHRHADLCKGVKFVDIDFPDLLAAKRNTVEQTPELRASLTGLEFPRDSPVLIRSDQYCQVACDLRQLSVIHDALSQVIDLASCEFLFVAEVSITYMDIEAADALIRWAGSLGDAEFCLLEQILPDGSANLFAHTMLQHFDKLNTPIKCVRAYPTTDAQKQRFQRLGWQSTRAWTLWEAWSDPLFFSPDERRALDSVEMFDEWEEFANFASHYFLLSARNGPATPDEVVQRTAAIAGAGPSVPITPLRLRVSPVTPSKLYSPRRFGAALVMKDVYGCQSVANFLGSGAEGRLRSCELYDQHSPGHADLSLPNLHRGGPAARSCFTLTDIGEAGYLLAGGRASPAAPFNDSWLFKKDSNTWVKSHSLPTPLYRHAAVRLGGSQLVLLAGGKTGAAAVHRHFLLYHPQSGWSQCAVVGGLLPEAVFGGLLLSTGHTAGPSLFHGVLGGGMTDDGLVCPTVVDWTLDASNVAKPTICFRPTATPQAWAPRLFCRFGAIATQVDGWTVVAGGIVDSGSVLREAELVRFRAYGSEEEVVECLDYGSQLDADALRPVLVGASIVGKDNGEVVIVGGGMTSFSMGTVWSKGIYTFNIRHLPAGKEEAEGMTPWHYCKTLAVTNEEPSASTDLGVPSRGRISAAPVSRLRLDSDEQFRALLRGGKPVVIEGLDLGACLGHWNLDYLVEHIGPERNVVVHETTSQTMDFLSKNFRYQTQTFKAFAQAAERGAKVYLRALSAEHPSDAPAKLEEDFPSIAGDFVLPPQLAFARERLFSSVLRISGPVNMWLHYDVLANVYCQVQGTKHFYLFPPSDVTQLGFAPGASSSSVDVFASLRSASLPPCHPYEAVVGPGDVLFLPQLWLHTAAPISGHSVAVNVFFRDLDTGYSTGRDVYGNRDLAAYEKARQEASKITSLFKHLPRDTREFYLRRVADELLQSLSD